MTDAKEALHSIRNDLSPILFCAELAAAGDLEAQEMVVQEVLRRSGAIRAELDVLTDAVREQNEPNGAILKNRPIS
jgi:hypothetical protein